MTYKPHPLKKEGNQDEVITSDDNTQELLKQILIQLKIMNLRQQEISGEIINEGDIEC